MRFDALDTQVFEASQVGHVYLVVTVSEVDNDRTVMHLVHVVYNEMSMVATKETKTSISNCGEGELVGGVHTLVWRSVQVYHELHELEEEDKGREEVQEIERESQVEENHSHGHDYGDDMKGLQRLEPQCVCR